MTRRIHLGTAWCLFSALTIAGCGGPKNEPDAMAQRNQNLASQLNKAQTDLAAALQERNALNERLRALMAEADSLRNQLNTLPTEPAPVGWTAVPGGRIASRVPSTYVRPAMMKPTSQTGHQ